MLEQRVRTWDGMLGLEQLARLLAWEQELAACGRQACASYLPGEGRQVAHHGQKRTRVNEITEGEQSRGQGGRQKGIP